MKGYEIYLNLPFIIAYNCLPGLPRAEHRTALDGRGIGVIVCVVRDGISDCSRALISKMIFVIVRFCLSTMLIRGLMDR